MAQRLAVEAQFARVADDGGDAVLFEQCPEQREFGRQELFRRVFIDDGDAPQGGITPLQTPFLAKHGDEFITDARPLGCPAVLGQQVGIEQATAGIGVDFDELRAGGRQVEIVAHEGTPRRARQAGDGWRLGQGMRLVGRQRDDRFDGGDQVGHRLQRRGRNREGGGREKLRLGVAQLVESGFHGLSVWRRNRARPAIRGCASSAAGSARSCGRRAWKSVAGRRSSAHPYRSRRGSGGRPPA